LIFDQNVEEKKNIYKKVLAELHKEKALDRKNGPQSMINLVKKKKIY
jgi:hypothetical protein